MNDDKTVPHDCPTSTPRTPSGCPACGGIHFGSYSCPYSEVICGLCDKPLLEHDSYAFCDGGKPKHNPAAGLSCACDECGVKRMELFHARRKLDSRELAAFIVEDILERHPKEAWKHYIERALNERHEIR